MRSYPPQYSRSSTPLHPWLLPVPNCDQIYMFSFCISHFVDTIATFSLSLYVLIQSQIKHSSYFLFLALLGFWVTWGLYLWKKVVSWLSISVESPRKLVLTKVKKLLRFQTLVPTSSSVRKVERNLESLCWFSYLCQCVQEREIDVWCVCLREKEIERWYVCVCVRERERKRRCVMGFK